MKLIENGNVNDPKWTDEIISLDDYLESPQQSGTVRVTADSDIDTLTPHIEKLDLIVINFTSSADGRGFSTARRLRQTLGYSEKIWASGNLIPDQYLLAIQCGIDAVLVDEKHLERQPIEQWRNAIAIAPLPYNYQEDMLGTADIVQQEKSNRVLHDGTIDFLNARYAKVKTEHLLEKVLADNSMGIKAMVSSFGTESSVLLHMLAQCSADTPVLFIDTGKLFPETFEYKDQLVEQLKLTNVQVLQPDEAALAKTDPQSELWQNDIAACCNIRKVAPLQRALSGYDTWISGRKSFQNNDRASLQVFERSGQQIKVNPLARWGQEELDAYMKRHDLPVHPLVAKGYTSVGCAPCTTPVKAGEDARSGRWRGENKTECGIHFIYAK